MVVLGRLLYIPLLASLVGSSSVQASFCENARRAQRDIGQQHRTSNHQDNPHFHSPRSIPPSSGNSQGYPVHQTRNLQPDRTYRNPVPSEHISTNNHAHQSYPNRDEYFRNVARPNRNVCPATAEQTCDNIPVNNRLNRQTAPDPIEEILKMVMKIVKVEPASEKDAGSRRRRYVEVMMNVLDQYFLRRDDAPPLLTTPEQLASFVNKIFNELISQIGFLDCPCVNEKTTCTTSAVTDATEVVDTTPDTSDVVTSEATPSVSEGSESSPVTDPTTEMPAEDRKARQLGTFRKQNRGERRRIRQNADMSETADCNDSSASHVRPPESRSPHIQRTSRNVQGFQPTFERAQNVRHPNPVEERRNVGTVYHKRNVESQQRSMPPNGKCDSLLNANEFDRVRLSRNANKEAVTDGRPNRQLEFPPTPEYKLGDPRLTLRIFMGMLMKMAANQQANGERSVLSQRDQTQTKMCLAREESDPQAILECLNEPYLGKKRITTEFDEFQPDINYQRPEFEEIFDNYNSIFRNSDRSARATEGDSQHAYIVNGKDVRPTLESIVKISSKILNIDPAAKEYEPTIANILNLYKLIVERVNDSNSGRFNNEDKNDDALKSKLKVTTDFPATTKAKSESASSEATTVKLPARFEGETETSSTVAPKAGGTIPAGVLPLPQWDFFRNFDFFWWAKPPFWLSLDL